MKAFLFLVLALASLPGRAGSPAEIRQSYAAEAARSQPGFTPSPARGEALFRRQFAVNERMPACTACHTDNPAQAGRHAVTGKAIRPLALSANAERLGDPAKVEKWFGRNCKEVVGRICSPAEKADVLAFLMEAR